MSVSSDPRNFFQSDVSLEKAERRSRKKKELKDKGSPIQVATKILALQPDHSSPGHVFIAEAGNVSRRLNIQDPKEPHRIYRGHTAPVTSLTLNRDASILYSGSWDKSILAFSTTEKTVLKTFIGHADFIKALLYVDTLPTKPMLISASSDSSIIIWNPETAEKLHTLKSHSRGVQALAVDPVESTRDAVVLYSASSKREIKKWVITTEKVTETAEIVQHETSVNRIRFLGDEGEEDLWSASSDMTAKRFERSSLEAFGRAPAKGIHPDTELWHGDFVTDVAMDITGRWVVTSCSDEEIRVWDAGSSKLYHTLSGHFDVVTGLAVLGTTLVSVSLDATVRTWSLKAPDLKAAVEAAEKAETGEVAVGSVSQGGRSRSNSMLTAEEERELAELMAEDDD